MESINTDTAAENTIIYFQRTPRLDISDPQVMRQTLRDYFINTFDQYTQLFDSLNCDEAYYVKPISLRHPLIFYFGHTATFFVNKLLLARLMEKRLDERLESIFAVGVDEMSWDDLDDANYDWPSVQEVRDYRTKLRTAVLNVIDNAPLTTPINWQNPWWAIIMGIEHERIHLETSSVLIRQHDLKYVQDLAGWPVCNISGEAPENELLPVTGAKFSIGKERQSPFYGWDNEYCHHEADVASFKASKYVVSNQEYLAFMEAGGYQTPSYWTEEGQGWLAYSERQHPEFWVKKPNGWHLRLMTQEVPMPWDWPAEVNYLEAKAFCNWKAAATGLPIRLPTEDEWHRLYQTTQLPANDPEGKWPANIHMDHWASACPVNHFAHGDFYDVTGNVWQWSETPTYPFDGFEVHPHYDDFTMPTFDAKHNLILGGSWISCGNEAQLSSRYAFRRHFFQHAGFRYVESDAPVIVPPLHYETDPIMADLAEYHYGDEYLNTPNIHNALVETITPYVEQTRQQKALDLGCAVGRASFELAKHFHHVDGVDFSARFINLGVQLNNDGVLRYATTDEGELQHFHSRKLADLGLDEVPAPEFMQGDACNLKPTLANYDLVLAANLLEHLYEPKKFLTSIHERINNDGYLVLSSSYHWDEEHTPKASWIGGIKKDAERYTTLDGLKDILSEHFELVAEPLNLPSVKRITSRTFHYQDNEVTVWRKRKASLQAI